MSLAGQLDSEWRVGQYIEYNTQPGTTEVIAKWRVLHKLDY